MNQNKTSKYFKYAIGEILLVVIGILIALQINNWNEENNQQNTVKALFLDVQRDLLNDIEEASFVMDWYEKLDTIAKNIYNSKYKKEDYLNAKSDNIYKPGLTSFPLQLSKQSFDALNSKKELILEEHQELLKNLNSIYNEQAQFLELRQNESIQHTNNYIEYLHANYDWVIDYKNKNYTDELIEYHLNNNYHKRQVLLWSQYTGTAYRHVSQIKNDAIANALIIHNLFTPNKKLPEILNNQSYYFTINTKEDYIGAYDSANEERDYYLYVQNNLLFCTSDDDRKIYGTGMPLIELGKDSLGFAALKNYTMIFKRDNNGNVIGIEGFEKKQKVVEFSKLEDD